MEKKDSALIGKMVDGCDVKQWPTEGQNHPMRGICMYWRRKEEGSRED